MSKNYLGYGRNEIICNYCHESIAIDEPTDHDTLSIRYAGLNNDEHECWRCKKRREAAYDRWVMEREAS